MLITSVFQLSSEHNFHYVLSNLQLLFFPLILVGLSTSSNTELFKLMTRSFALALPASMMIGIVQRLYFWMLPHGGLGNASVYATVSIIAGLICLSNFQAETRVWKTLSIIGYLSSVVIVFLVFSKNAILLFTFSAVALLLIAVKRRIIDIRYIIAISMILPLVIAVSLVITGYRGNLLEQRLFTNFETLQTEGITVKSVIGSTRYHMLTYGLQSAEENLLFGVGHQTRNSIVSELAKADGVKIRPATHLHNEYLNQLVGGGVIGLLAYIALLAAPFTSSILSQTLKDKSARIYASACLSFGFGFAALSNVHLGQDVLVTFYLFVMAVLLVKNATKPRVENASSEPVI